MLAAGVGLKLAPEIVIGAPTGPEEGVTGLIRGACADAFTPAKNALARANRHGHRFFVFIVRFAFFSGVSAVYFCLSGNQMVPNHFASWFHASPFAVLVRCPFILFKSIGGEAPRTSNAAASAAGTRLLQREG